MNVTQLKAALPRELLASVVVFLVALPLCMGIASPRACRRPRV